MLHAKQPKAGGPYPRMQDFLDRIYICIGKTGQKGIFFNERVKTKLFFQ